MQTVQLQVRHTLDASGRTVAANTVYCPFTARCVSLEDCGSCQHAHVDPRRGRFACAHPAVEMDPRDLREPDRTRVGQVMTRNVFCVREDVPVATVAQLLDSQSFSGVPVVDEQGRPQGIISRADVVHLCAEGEELNLATIPARDVMSARAICVEVSTSLSMAAALMAYQRIQRVPVIDQEGKVVGMLAALDVLRWLGEADGYLYGRGHTAH